MSNDLKAYIVSDKWNENSIVVWAESDGKAKSEALTDAEFAWFDYSFVELRTRRMKEWDKYAENKKVPIEELLKNSWWFECKGLCGKQINEDDVKDGNAFIIEDERHDFVKGNVICKECFEKEKQCQ